MWVEGERKTEEERKVEGERKAWRWQRIRSFLVQGCGTLSSGGPCTVPENKVIFSSPLIGQLFVWEFKKSQKGDAVTLIAKPRAGGPPADQHTSVKCNHTAITLEKMYSWPSVFYAFHAVWLFNPGKLSRICCRTWLTDLHQPSRVLKQHLSHWSRVTLKV